MNDMDRTDFLIVGGGTAGAVLAARLSEDPATRVLLIEAGRDTPPDAVPADIADTFPRSSLNPGYFWPGLTAVCTTKDDVRAFPQARVMGGGSSVMGLWALRGLPADFDSWAAAGAEGWAWSDVVKYFRRLEDDFDRKPFGNEPAPVPIRRVPKNEWPPFVAALERAAVARGLGRIADINENPGDGFFPMPLSQGEWSRSSSASCYLTSAVRRRANLAIMANTHVTALNLVNGEVTGVTADSAGKIVNLNAHQVILCAGAIHSPALLLRAGIGPAPELQRLGIAPVVDRPGVGRNLQNHPYLHFALTLPPGRRIAAHLRRFAIAGMRFSSGMSGCPASDLVAYAVGRVSPRTFGPDIVMVGAALYKPFSRGAVTLTSPDWRAAPRIEFGMLQDPRDPPRLIQAARFAESLLLEPGVAASYGDAFLLPPVMALQQFNRPGALGALIALTAKAVLNGPAPLRRTILGSVLRPGRWFANRSSRSSLSDEELLGAASPMAHPVGTCAIGRPDDPTAVVDRACRVHGIGNLRVVDASIMPRIPSANTNLPATMVAERAADLIRSGAGSR